MKNRNASGAKVSRCETATTLLALLCLSPLFASHTLAEVFTCDGVFQDRPCNTASSSSLETSSEAAEAKPSLKSVSPTKEERRELSKRKLWLHDLEMLRLRTKRELEISPSIREVEELCLDLANSSLDCSQAVSKKEGQFNQLLLEQKKLKAQEERNRIESAKAKPESAVTVINEERNVIILPQKRPHYPYVSDLKSGDPHPKTEAQPKISVDIAQENSTASSSEAPQKPRNAAGLGLPLNPN